MADEKKVPFQSVLRTYNSLISGGTLGGTIFPERIFPFEFYAEESNEGERRLLRNLGDGVMTYVSETMLVNALLFFSSKLPEKEFKSYLLDADKAKKVAKYWLGSQSPFKQNIYPVLQKSTAGYCFHRLDFNKQKEDTEIFDYLCGSLDSNKEAFLAYLGALFDPNAKLQQFLWLSGTGGNGKGALLRLIARIFAQSYVSVTTENRHIDKYWQSSLVGKRVAVCGDTKNLDFVNSSIFMQVTGGDYVTVRPMYEKAYTTKLDTMFIFAANADPRTTSEDSAQRRAIICTLDKGKYQHFDDFEERLWSERAGIVYKCVEAWNSIKHKKNIPVDTKKLEDLADQNEEEWEYLTNRYFEVDPQAEIDASLVMTILREGEKKQLSSNQMADWKRYLKRIHGVTNVRKYRDSNRLSKHRVYVGLRERKPSDTQPNNGSIAY